MTERERQQVRALKAVVVDADLADSDWDVKFINSLADQAANRGLMFLTDGQAKQLRRLLSKYLEALTAAGKRDLAFSVEPKGKVKA